MGIEKLEGWKIGRLEGCLRKDEVRGQEVGRLGSQDAFRKKFGKK